MKTICSCLQCKKEFPVKGLFTHVDRTHLKLSKYSSGNNGRYKEISNKANVKRQNAESLYMSTPKHCVECDSILPFVKKDNQFCSNSCSAKQSNRLRTETGWASSFEHRKKTSEKLTGRTYVEPVIVSQICLCGIEFSYTKIGNKNRKYCSKSCATKYSPSHIKKRETARNNRTALVNYRSDCSFKFVLNDFPEEFDFSLIEKYGWYKAKNKGNNLYGVSRDHIVSVRYGYDNQIDPAIISHPANCKLVRHSENVSKGIKCDMTIEMLLEKIKQWEIKYKS